MPNLTPGCQPPVADTFPKTLASIAEPRPGGAMARIAQYRVKRPFSWGILTPGNLYLLASAIHISLAAR